MYITWSASNNMLLNPSKRVIMNIFLPSKCIAVIIDLCLMIDNHLSFTEHIDNIVTKRKTGLFVMKKLQTIGLNVTGIVIVQSSLGK